MCSASSGDCITLISDDFVKCVQTNNGTIHVRAGISLAEIEGEWERV